MAMNWEYNFVNDRNLLTLRATGKFSVASFEKMIIDILSDKRWLPGMDCLIDHSTLDLSETSSDHIKAAADIHKRYNAQVGQGRIAVVLGSEVDFGLGRMYEMFVESAVLATVRSFRTADEAREWLAEDNSDHS
jgi:hypothetical protein